LILRLRSLLRPKRRGFAGQAGQASGLNEKEEPTNKSATGGQVGGQNPPEADKPVFEVFEKLVRFRRDNRIRGGVFVCLWLSVPFVVKTKSVLISEICG
jgi:hypothetical protein